MAVWHSQNGRQLTCRLNAQRPRRHEIVFVAACGGCGKAVRKPLDLGRLASNCRPWAIPIPTRHNGNRGYGSISGQCAGRPPRATDVAHHWLLLPFKPTPADPVRRNGQGDERCRDVCVGVGGVARSGAWRQSHTTGHGRQLGVSGAHHCSDCCRPKGVSSPTPSTEEARRWSREGKTQDGRSRKHTALLDRTLMPSVAQSIPNEMLVKAGGRQEAAGQQRHRSQCRECPASTTRLDSEQIGDCTAASRCARWCWHQPYMKGPCLAHGSE